MNEHEYDRNRVDRIECEWMLNTRQTLKPPLPQLNIQRLDG